MTCHHVHRYNPMFKALPEHQGGYGRHKCAGCAYAQGYEAGLMRLTAPKIDLNALPNTQAGHVRHKCPLAAFALGYQHGIEASFQKVS